MNRIITFLILIVLLVAGVLSGVLWPIIGASVQVLSIAFAGGSLLVSSLVGPKAPNPTKLAAYESGNVPQAKVAGSRFSVKFYMVAMLFLIFDVEAVFLYPWAVVLRDLGWYGFAVMAVFVALLFESYY